jgi:hypothetical protein
MLQANKNFMTTIINTTKGEGLPDTVSLIIGAIVLAVAVVLFFTYALPIIKNSNSSGQDGSVDVKVQLPPSGDQSGATNEEPLYKY